MDISAIYSKTPKGLRARASLIGGLSSHLMKVLTHVDGSSKAENILLKFDKLTPQQLSADLTKLEQEGYIRLATVTSANDNSWALTINFEPMVVEEYQSEEELEVDAQANKAEQTRQQEQQQAEQAQAMQLAVEQQAKLEEEQRQVAQQKAEKKAQKLRAKEKTKAETKVKALLEQERIAIEAAKSDEVARIKIEAEAKLIAQQEAARVAERQAAERAAKIAEERARKASLKAREVAEQAEIDAEEKAKQHAHREIERISREAEEAQKKADAEIRAKQEAERLEQLRIAKAAEDMRQAELKVQAEYQAQLELAANEAAGQARVVAEAVAEAAEKQQLEQAEKAVLKEKLVQEQKEKARLEIANVLRKAEADRKNAVVQAKAEKLEAKRQAKEEQEARLQAERKAKEEKKELAKQQKLKAQAEEKAKTEAADNAQREAVRIAKEAEVARKNAFEKEQLLLKQEIKQATDALAAQVEAEQLERLKAEHLIKSEHQAQQAAGVLRAKLIAEEQANIIAKENARLEMERIGQEADIARQKTTTQQHLAEVKKGKPDKDLPVRNDFDAAEAAEEATFEADEQAEEAVEKIQRTIRKTGSEKTAKQAAEDAGRADIKNAAKVEADAMANVYSNAQAYVSAKKIMQWLGLFTKVTFIYVPVLALILFLLLHFINLSILIKPIEKLASESLGEPVAIKKVHASLWPQPHLVLEDVAIGTGNNIKAVHVLPVAASLFEDIIVVKSLVIEGLNIEQANFSQPLQWASNTSKSKRLVIEQINLKNLTMSIRDLQLQSFDGKVTLTHAGALSLIELVSSNNALSVKISPQGDHSEVVLKATNWVLPFNQKIMFAGLNAKGLASQNQLNFSEIEGEIFGGNLTGQANIEWPSGAGSWLSSGKFKLVNANAQALLNNFGSAVIIDGQLALEANFSGKAREASKLSKALITNADFDVRQGRIQGIALARGVLSPGRQSLAGDNTDFDKLTGSIKIIRNNFQFGKLVLESSQFNANGFININANQILTGRINADLTTKSRHLQAKYAITGRGKDLKSQ